jgi:hypothetical protein
VSAEAVSLPRLHALAHRCREAAGKDFDPAPEEKSKA